MRKIRKKYPINSISIGIGRDHLKLGVRKCDARVVSNTTWGVRKYDMLVDRFHGPLPKAA